MKNRTMDRGVRNIGVQDDDDGGDGHIWNLYSQSDFLFQFSAKGLQTAVLSKRKLEAVMCKKVDTLHLRLNTLQRFAHIFFLQHVQQGLEKIM